MSITRRDMLRQLSKGAFLALGTGVATPTSAHAQGPSRSGDHDASIPARPVAMLYDATRCIGCQACVSACAQANNQPQIDKPEPSPQQANIQANATPFARNAIKLYKNPDGSAYSFVKQQCMHCIDPPCVASCLFRALHKDAQTGIVRWTPSRCVGCRYCEIVCPYHIPRFQWHGFNPSIVKCEFCHERLDRGEDPACTSVCPTRAVMFGQRANLVREANSRIARYPATYFQHRAFGVEDGGGTQVLYLSKVSFDKIGLPRLGAEATPSRYLKWQRLIYSYLIAPAVAYALLVGMVGKRWKERRLHLERERTIYGWKPQL